jgi:protein-S-isoprenylcysteine O-methyltransferase Ste14
MSLAGLIIIVISCINLGNSNRLGLPVGNTKLKVTGLYKLSRNPMYLGFNLLTISSVIFTLNIVTALMGIYSILIYHFIILAEEKFLEERFGSEYIEYKKRVGRYI